MGLQGLGLKAFVSAVLLQDRLLQISSHRAVRVLGVHDHLEDS